MKDVIAGVTWRSFLQACVNENARRMAEMDQRLLQPRVLAAISKAALRLPALRLRRKSPPMVTPQT